MVRLFCFTHLTGAWNLLIYRKINSFSHFIYGINHAEYLAASLQLPGHWNASSGLVLENTRFGDNHVS